MLTLETVIAIALKHPHVLEALAGPLTSDLVVTSPFMRRLLRFTIEFHAKYNRIPTNGDYTAWLSTLTENLRRGIQEAFARIAREDTAGYTPEYVAEHALREFKQAAAYTATHRLAALGDQLTDEAFQTLARQVEALAVGEYETAAGTGVQPMGPPGVAVRSLLHMERELRSQVAVPELIPRLAWRGMLTVLSGAPKLGKSTLLAEGIGAMTYAAPFLGGRAGVRTAMQGPLSLSSANDDADAAGLVEVFMPGRALWFGVGDESIALTVGRLTERDDADGMPLAHADHVMVFDYRRRTVKLDDVLAQAIVEHRPDVVVVDTLIAWARATAKETPASGDAAAWADVVRPLGELARRHDVAVVVLHHARRQDGRMRDSDEIVAAADVGIEMLQAGAETAPLRRFIVRSRMHGRSVWHATRDRGYYRTVEVSAERESGRPPQDTDQLDSKILDFLRTLPADSHCTLGDVQKNVTGQNKRIAERVDALNAAGHLRYEKPERRGQSGRIWLVPGK